MPQELPIKQRVQLSHLDFLVFATGSVIPTPVTSSHPHRNAARRGAVRKALCDGKAELHVVGIALHPSRIHIDPLFLQGVQFVVVHLEEWLASNQLVEDQAQEPNIILAPIGNNSDVEHRMPQRFEA